MKKLMFVAVAALCGAVGFADVQSANIVGYNTVNIARQYQLIAVNFEGTGVTEMDIQDIFKKSEGMTTGNAAGNADQIQIMKDGGTYDYYYLSNGNVGKLETPATLDKWVCDNEGADKTIPAVRAIGTGTGFWYVSKNGATTPYTITVAGAVAAAPTVAKEFGVTYSLIGNPYPAEIPLNDGLVLINGTSGNAAGNADQLQIMKADGSYDYYYFSNGNVGKLETPATLNKWVCDNEGADKTVPTTDTFPVGRAGWFVRKNTETKLSFVSPISKDAE